jgi:hypothetical protein
VRDLLAFEPGSRGTDIGAAVEEANRILSRRAVVFVISDWRSPRRLPTGASRGRTRCGSRG